MNSINKNYITGNWVEGVGEISNVNPSDLGDEIGIYSQASASQLDDALKAAISAQKLWQGTGIEARYEVLMSIGQELIARSAELGKLLSREEGKPFLEGKGEVYRAGQFFTYYAAEVLRQIGDSADSVREGIEIDVRREPVGVVAVISPWNFPMATACWKIAPALAFGNAVLWKPANLTPASAVALTEIISRQNLPKGLFNLVMGQGKDVGQKLVESPWIDAISFTGSLEVGRHLATSCIANLTRIQLEMGSKNALVVMDDADLEVAVSAAVNGAFGGTGQKCTASSRLVVHESIHDQFVERLVSSTKKLVVDHALKEGTQIGPVCSDSQLQANLANIELAQKEGAERLCGGVRLQREHEGFYMSPAVFINTTNHFKVNQEELFAPIACVIKVDSYEQALETVNDTRFGLTSGIITKSLARASDFRRRAKSGCVMVNLPTAGTDYHVPFGGRGDSSYGPREQGKYARDFYTIVKTAYSFAGKPD